MRDQRVGFIWVVEIRKADTGAIVQRRSFGTNKAARRWKYHLDELPDPALDGCIIEVKVDALGGHLKTGHTWPLQNRPTNAGPGQEYL